MTDRQEAMVLAVGFTILTNVTSGLVAIAFALIAITYAVIAWRAKT